MFVLLQVAAETLKFVGVVGPADTQFTPGLLGVKLNVCEVYKGIPSLSARS